MQLGSAVDWKKVFQGMSPEEQWGFITTQGPDYILALSDVQGFSPGHDANSILVHTSHGMLELDKVQGEKILVEWKAFVQAILAELK